MSLTMMKTKHRREEMIMTLNNLRITPLTEDNKLFTRTDQRHNHRMLKVQISSRMTKIIQLDQYCKITSLAKVLMMMTLKTHHHINLVLQCLNRATIKISSKMIKEITQRHLLKIEWRIAISIKIQSNLSEAEQTYLFLSTITFI